MPPVESTLVCKEIKQRTQSRSFNDGASKRMFKSFYFGQYLINSYFLARFTAAISKAMQEKALRGI